MARPKKDGTYLNVRIETAIYERLEKFSEVSGQSKTFAVERALVAYMVQDAPISPAPPDQAAHTWEPALWLLHSSCYLCRHVRREEQPRACCHLTYQ